MLDGVGMDLAEGVFESGIQHKLAYGQVQRSPTCKHPLGVLGPIQMRRTIEVSAQENGDRLIAMSFLLEVLQQRFGLVEAA